MKTRIARALSVSVIGIAGHIVEVESHVTSGLVSFTLVGLPDTSMKEAKERVRSALYACDCPIPDARVTVNLSPADIPKSGAGCDVSIAVSILIATGQLQARPFHQCVLLGELALDGSLRPVRGILPAVMAARARGLTHVIVATGNEAEARMVPGMDVRAFAHLADLIQWAGGQAQRPAGLMTHQDDMPASHPHTPAQCVDLSDIRGQEQAVRALEVSAAGGHHMHLIGEPGAGKTMLAQRLPTILPELDDTTALNATAIHSIAGALNTQRLLRQPPISAPHHSITLAAMIGGGAQVPRPGAVSLAHGGVLFLDEAPEFAPSVLDALRQPLEEGIVHLHRAKAATIYPARFQLLLASNPCPCGYYGARKKRCTCSSVELRRYQARLSGPLRDRIDITVGLQAPTKAQLRSHSAPPSETVRAHVVEARNRMRHRLKDTPWETNTCVPGSWLRRNFQLSNAVRDTVDSAIDKGILSLRGADRVLRIMWTLADLDGRPYPDLSDLGEAMMLRTGGEAFNAAL